LQDDLGPESKGNDDDYEEDGLTMDDDLDEVNSDVYDDEILERNDVQKSEQAGVLHLVHRWTQQAQPEKVSLFPFKAILVYLTFTITIQLDLHRV
jgi:hypothetical protein